MQFDGRMEGFEHYIESLFGPGGLYHQKEVGYILESLRSKIKVTPSSPNQPDAGKLKVMGEQFDAASRFTDEPEVRRRAQRILQDQIMIYVLLINYIFF